MTILCARMREYGMSDTPLIAIVDDDVMVCEATEDLIEAFGFNACTFTSADEFLDFRLRSRHFVLDCRRADAWYEWPATSPQTHRVRSSHPGSFYYRFPRRARPRAGAECWCVVLLEQAI